MLFMRMGIVATVVVAVAVVTVVVAAVVVAVHSVAVVAALTHSRLSKSICRDCQQQQPLA